MRQIILDTETTGLEPKYGHRIIEIGCIELIDRQITDNTFHVYLNPEREVDQGAFKVHGLSTHFLRDKPIFKEVVDDFLAFINGDELIIHNAPFDVGFINHEFKLLKPKLKSITHYCKVFDTLKLARKMFPGKKNSLDALCKRFEVDNSGRDLHGALLDSELLALVYLAMTGGQDSLFSEVSPMLMTEMQANHQMTQPSFSGPFKVIRATEAECEAHESFFDEGVK